MFVDVCHRLHQARVGSPRKLAASFGTNVARYASTLSHFVGYMLLHPDQEQLARLTLTRMAKIEAKFSKGEEKVPAVGTREI